MNEPLVTKQGLETGDIVTDLPVKVEKTPERVIEITAQSPRRIALPEHWGKPFQSPEMHAIGYLVNQLQRNSMPAQAAMLRGCYDNILFEIQRLIYLNELDKDRLADERESYLHKLTLYADEKKRYEERLMEINDKWEAIIRAAIAKAHDSQEEYQVAKAKYEELPGLVSTPDEIERMQGASPGYKPTMLDHIIEWLVKISFGSVLGISFGLLVKFINQYRIASTVSFIFACFGIGLAFGVGKLLMVMARKARLEELYAEERFQNEKASLEVVAEEYLDEKDQPVTIDKPKNENIVTWSRLGVWATSITLIATDLCVTSSGIFAMMIRPGNNNWVLYIACLVIVFPFVLLHVITGTEQAVAEFNYRRAEAINDREMRLLRGMSDKQDLDRVEKIAELRAISECDSREVVRLEAARALEITKVKAPIEPTEHEDEERKKQLKLDIKEAKRNVRDSIRMFRNNFTDAALALQKKTGEVVRGSFFENLMRWLRS